MAKKPRFYECDICSHIHPWDWNGDCRDDAARFTIDQIKERYGDLNFDLLSMDDRIAADQET